jgi:hypothetical protein
MACQFTHARPVRLFDMSAVVLVPGCERKVILLSVHKLNYSYPLSESTPIIGKGNSAVACCNASSTHFLR